MTSDSGKSRTSPSTRRSSTADRRGRALRWRAAGAGSPAVLLEAGLGSSSDWWEQIFDRVSEFTTVIAYDRVGYGRSGDGQPTSEDSVLDLEEVLRDAGAPDSLVLVGYSWGGVLVRLYAARHPDRVAALVLVDATHEGLSVFTNRIAAALSRAASRLQVRAAKSGRVRRTLEAGMGQMGTTLSELPEPMRTTLIEEASTPRTAEQAGKEMRLVAPTLRSMPTSIPAVPVVAVIAGSGKSKAEQRDRTKVRAAYEKWLRTLPYGRLVDAPNSNHFVPQQDPDLLVEIIHGSVTDRN